MNGLVSSSKLFIKRNAATILTVMGGAGVIATSIAAVKAAPKAQLLLDEAKKEKGEDLTRIEKVKIAGPTYIPSILIGTGTIACIFGANILNKRHQAALVGAYTLIDSSFKEYKQKLKEVYGEEAHNNVVNAIVAEKADPEIVGKGAYFGQVCDLSLEEACGEPVLFYEEYSNRYFEATVEQVIIAEYHLNRNYTLRGVAFLNELYEYLGLETNDYGAVMGWANTDEGEAWVEFNHRKVTFDDGLECYIIEMPFAPTYDPWDY